MPQTSDTSCNSVRANSYNMSTYSITPPVTPERRPSHAAHTITQNFGASAMGTTSSRIPLGNSSNYLVGHDDGILNKAFKSPVLKSGKNSSDLDLKKVYKSLIYSGNYERFDLERDCKERTLRKILYSLQDCALVVPHVAALSQILLFPQNPSVDISSYEVSANFACTKENEYLFLTALPAIVRELLNKRFISLTEKKQVSLFFQHVIALSLRIVTVASEFKFIQLVNTLSRIFDMARKFYEPSSYMNKINDVRENEENVEIVPSATERKRILRPPKKFDFDSSPTKLRQARTTKSFAKGSDESTHLLVEKENVDVCNSAGNFEMATANKQPETKLYAKMGNAISATPELVSNINFFGRLGGFDVLLRQSYEINVKGTFDSIAQVIEPIVRTRTLLTDDTLTYVVEKLFESVSKRVSGLSDSNIRANDIHSVLQLVEQLNLVMFQLHDREVVRKKTIPLEILVALRFVQCNNLAKRLNGLKYISQKVIRSSLYTIEADHMKTHVEDLDSHSDLYGQYEVRDAHKTPPRQIHKQQTLNSIRRRTYRDLGTPPSQMVSYLMQYQVVDILFGRFIHTELINRAHDILRFLAFNDALKASHLDIIWNASIGQHVTIVNSIYNSFLAISQDLSPSLMNHLMGILKNISDLELDTLEFLGQLVYHSGNSRLVLSCVLSILWQFLFADNDLPNNDEGDFRGNSAAGEQIHEEIERLIVSLLGSEMSQALRLPEKYCKLCIIQIKSGKNVLCSLRLIQKVVESSDFADELLDTLEKEDNILSLLVEDLSSYQKSAVESISKKKLANDKLPIDINTKTGQTVLRATLVGTTCHEESLFERLKTLLFVLQNSSSNLRLSLDATKSLWGTAVQCALTSRDLTLLMEFFVHAIDLEDDDRRYIDEQSATFVFDQLKHESIPYGKYDLFTTKCFMTYFRFENRKQGKLVTESCKTYFARIQRMACPPQLYHDEGGTNREIEYRDWRVSTSAVPQGLETLWDILRHSKDQAVVDYVVTIMNNMHLETGSTRIGIPIEYRAREQYESIKLLRRSYIETCIHQYFVGEKMYSARQHLALRTFQIASCVLCEFMNAADKHSEQMLAINKTDTPLQSMSSVTHDESKEHEAEIKLDDSDAMIRTPLPALSRIPSFGSPSSVSARPLNANKNFEARATVDIESIRPSSILRTGDLFEVLLKFLNLDVEFAHAVYQVVKKIPLSEHVLQKILELDNIDVLQELLPAERPFHLLHTLSVIDKILLYSDKGTYMASNKKDKSLAGQVTSLHLKPSQRVFWVQRFLCLGGMQTLLSIIKQYQHFIHLNESDAFRYRNYLELSKQIVSTIAAVHNVAKRSCFSTETDIVKSKARDQNLKVTVFYAWRYLIDSESHCLANFKTYHDDYQHFLVGSQPHLIDENLNLVLKVLIPNTNVELDHRSKVARCHVIKEAFNLLSALYHTNPQAVCYSLIYRQLHWISVLKYIFLRGSSTPAEIKMRSSVFESLSMICESSTEGHNGALFRLFKLFSTLLRTAPKVALVDNDKENFSNRFVYEFFLVFSNIVQSLPVDHQKSCKAIFEEVGFVLDLINSLTPCETSFEFADDEGVYCRADTDYMLTGLLMLLSSMVKKRPLVSRQCLEKFRLGFKALNEWLYPSRLTKSPICKSEFSRKYAFETIINIVLTLKGTKECDELILTEIAHPLSSVMAYNSGIHVGQSEVYDLAGRSTTGFVGLHNPGCICYMNSLIQQLFMTIDFREGILKTDADTLAVVPNSENKSVLYQLQTVFAKLYYSHRKAFPLTDFCNVYKDFDGNPTNVYIQQDADEFLRVFFDRLMASLAGSNQFNRLASCFGGKVVNQIICQDVPYVSEREEDCPFLTVDIKGKEDLLDALAAYVEGELLSGENAYYCEKYDKKVAAIKRICIRDLPNTLIIHLKRFEFNFDAMCQMKVNDYCQFPLELNMYPFTEAGLSEKETGHIQVAKHDASNGNAASTSKGVNCGEDKETAEKCLRRHKNYYEYELVGVVVHNGTTDSGHYYSLIQDRKQGEKGLWYKFNDENVSQFDMNHMGDECFGGEETVYGNQPGAGPRCREKCRNAYMLFYQRKKMSSETLNEKNVVATPKVVTEADVPPCPSVGPDATQGNANTLKNKIVSPRSLCAIQALSNAIIDDVRINSSILARTSGPNDILLKIQKDNLCLLQNQILNDQNSLSYVLKLIESISPPFESQIPSATYNKTGERTFTVTKKSKHVDTAGDQNLNPLFNNSSCKDLEQWSVSVLTTYFFDTLAPFLEKKSTYDEEAVHLAKRYLETMEVYFRRLPVNTIYFLQRAEREPNWICKYLVMSKNDKLRDAVADFLINSILSYYCHCEEAEYVEDEQILEFFEQVGSAFSEIIMHEQVAYHSRQLGQYFRVLNAVAKSSLLARYALNNLTQLTSKIIQCIFHRLSYTESETSKSNTHTKINRNKIDLPLVVEFLGILIRSCRRDEGKLALLSDDNDTSTSLYCEEDDSPGSISCTTSLPPTTLPRGVEVNLVPYYGETDCKVFENEEFIDALVTLNSSASRNIILHLSFGCLAFSKQICNAIIDNAQVAPTTGLAQILGLARLVLLINDDVQKYRVASLLNSRTGLASIAMSCKHVDAARSYTIMKSIAKWANGSAQTVDCVTEHLARDKESLELMESWLHQYKSSTISNQRNHVVPPPEPHAGLKLHQTAPFARTSSKIKKKKNESPRTAAPFSP